MRRKKSTDNKLKIHIFLSQYLYINHILLVLSMMIQNDVFHWSTMTAIVT